MPEYRFSVYGKPVAVVRTATGWDAFALGPDGKRRLLEIVVPDFIAAEELREFLADMFHEHAMAGNGDVVQL